MIRKTFLAVSVALASIISSSNFNLLRADVRPQYSYEAKLYIYSNLTGYVGSGEINCKNKYTGYDGPYRDQDVYISEVEQSYYVKKVRYEKCY